ncbi:MAG: hypothetical protein HY909_01835 [Deltaproteobacteria bacterium]|nr:hypothetical protein [Deltaproteobacteria bacterium]
MRLQKTLCALALGALTCRHPNTPAPMADAPPMAPPPVAATARDAGGGPSAGVGAGARALETLADTLSARMATLRGLALRRPIPRGVMSRAQIVARLRERTRQEYPGAEITLEGELQKRLGLLPESMDYEATVFALLEEQVLGFYDPLEQRLYIADWVPAEAQASTMAHELTHALQDQHFNIGRFTHHQQGGNDAQLAAMSVVEGDATAAMMDFAMRAAGRTLRDLQDPDALLRGQLQATADQPRLAAAPAALRDTLLFPYLQGFSLCARIVRADGDYHAINDLLATPPASTEQVLHADKLAAREPPIAVPPTVPAALARDFQLAYHDVEGELGLRLFLQTALPVPRADSGAAGWGGDHAVLLVPNGSLRPLDAGVELSPEALARDVLLWTVTMDPVTGAATDAQATEFAAGAQAVLAHRYPQAPVVSVPGAMVARVVSPGRVSLVARSGRTVLVGDRVPQDRAALVVRQVLAR